MCGLAFHPERTFTLGAANGSCEPLAAVRACCGEGLERAQSDRFSMLQLKPAFGRTRRSLAEYRTKPAFGNVINL